jgi:signal transduction histidine kinase
LSSAGSLVVATGTTTIQRTPAGVLATVEDNGAGFDTRDWQKRCSAGNHLGLLGIEERVTLLGGFFRVESVPGRGTSVFADIPVKLKIILEPLIQHFP